MRTVFLVACLALIAACGGESDETADWHHERDAMVERMDTRMGEIDAEIEALADDGVDPGMPGIEGPTDTDRRAQLERWRESIQELRREAVGHQTEESWSSWVSSTRRTRGELEI